MKATPSSRSYWLKTLHQWHWISSAACLASMLLFAVTGLTLNHADLIASTPDVVSKHAQLPDGLRAELAGQAHRQSDAKAALPEAALRWLDAELGVDARGRAVEWSVDEIYVSLPRAGGDSWLFMDLDDGAVEHEITDRGWIAYLNDLHKGRHTGAGWSAFIDVFALACVVFALTGLLLLKLHASRRPATWPLTGLGVLIPLVLALLLIH